MSLCLTHGLFGHGTWFRQGAPVGWVWLSDGCGFSYHAPGACRRGEGLEAMLLGVGVGHCGPACSSASRPRRLGLSFLVLDVVLGSCSWSLFLVLVLGSCFCSCFCRERWLMMPSPCCPSTLSLSRLHGMGLTLWPLDAVRFLGRLVAAILRNLLFTRWVGECVRSFRPLEASCGMLSARCCGVWSEPLGRHPEPSDGGNCLHLFLRACHLVVGRVEPMSRMRAALPAPAAHLVLSCVSCVCGYG